MELLKLIEIDNGMKGKVSLAIEYSMNIEGYWRWLYALRGNTMSISKIFLASRPSLFTLTFLSLLKMALLSYRN